MTTAWERTIRAVTDKHFEGAQPALVDEITIPVSLREVDESLAAWPFRKPREYAEPTLGERLIGRKLAPRSEPMMRRFDERECRAIYNRRDDK